MRPTTALALYVVVGSSFGNTLKSENEKELRRPMEAERDNVESGATIGKATRFSLSYKTTSHHISEVAVRPRALEDEIHLPVVNRKVNTVMVTITDETIIQTVTADEDATVPSPRVGVPDVLSPCTLAGVDCQNATVQDSSSSAITLSSQESATPTSTALSTLSATTSSSPRTSTSEDPAPWTTVVHNDTTIYPSSSPIASHITHVTDISTVVIQTTYVIGPNRSTMPPDYLYAVKSEASGKGEVGFAILIGVVGGVVGLG
jgi:hypothetical protein